MSNILLCADFARVKECREQKKFFLNSLGKKELSNIFFERMQRGSNIAETFGNVGIIKIDGVITSDFCEFQNLWGEISCEEIKKNIEIFLNNSKIQLILLCVNSPGGDVSGVQALSEYIYNDVRPIKKIIASVKSCACSAAYWIASACQNVFHTEDASRLGSIGVYTIVEENSQELNDIGVTITEIKTGELKTIGSPTRKIEDFELIELQKDVDILGQIFFESVSKYRNIEVEKIVQQNARVYRGAESIVVGLSDGKLNKEQIIMGRYSAQLEKEKAEEKEVIDEEKENALDEEAEEEKPETEEMEEETEEEAENKDLEETAEEEKKEVSAKTRQALIALGAKKERERISAIKSITVAGMKSFMDRQIEKGASVAQAAIAQAKQLKRNGISIDAIKADTNKISSAFSSGGTVKPSLASLVRPELRKK